MKFLLIGHGGCSNRGCEAIVRTTITLLCHNFTHPEIILPSFDYENEKLIDFGDGVTVIYAESKVWERFSKDWFIRQFSRIFMKTNVLKSEYPYIINHLKDVDAVLSVGGDNYTADYGYPGELLRLNNLIKLYRKKLIIWAASIGPFSEDENLKEIITNLKTVDLITARETETVNYLKSLGISENVRLVADPAFILQSDESVLDKALSIKSSKILGFNISPIMSRYTNKLNNNEIVHECVNFLRKVIEIYGMYVLLIPHVTFRPGNDDYCFMQNIYDALSDTGMISRVTPKYNAMQTKAIISKCCFFIGARTHATIAALSKGVPTISIGYSLKSKGINEDIFGHQGYVLPIKDLTAESLWSKFNSLILDESDIRRILSIRIPEIIKMAWKNIEYLEEICKNKMFIHVVKVSVIIPTYNAANYLQEAIDSVFKQTFKDYELIIVDDGSTDNTKSILSEYMERIKYIFQENKGPNTARNTGIKESNGKYLAFLDADDIWMPDKLEQQLKVLERNDNIGLVGCGCYIIDQFGNITKEIQGAQYANKISLIKELVIRSIANGSASGVIIPRHCFEVVGYFDEQLRGSEDRDMWLRILKNYEGDNVKKPLIKVRVHKNNAHKNIDMMMRNRRLFIRKNIPIYKIITRIKAYSYLNLDASREYYEGSKYYYSAFKALKAIILYPLKVFNDDDKYQLLIKSIIASVLLIKIKGKPHGKKN